MQVDDEPSVKEFMQRLNDQDNLIRELQARLLALETAIKPNPFNPSPPAGSGLFGTSFAPPCKVMHFATPSSFHPDRTFGQGPIFPPRNVRDPGFNWGM